MAMAAEAEPFRERTGWFGPWERLAAPLAARVCGAQIGGSEAWLVVHGDDAAHGVDAIGTQPAAVTGYAAVSRLGPSLVVNAGTAGGFARAGAAIGDVYLSDGPVVFHDRRVPLGAFEAAGVGSYPSVDCRGLAAKLGLKLGRITTGDSLDLSEADARQIAASGANVKDMEAAAVAWVAGLFGVPFVAVKAITDLVDGEHPTAAQFMANLAMATERLGEKLEGVVAGLVVGS